MKKHFIIPLVIYPFDVFVSIGQGDKELRKLIRGNGSKEDMRLCFDLPETTLGRCVMMPSNCTLIRLFLDRCDKGVLMGIIAHEVFHAVTLIMDRIGVTFGIGVSDEAYAYLIGYLVEKIFCELEI